MGKLNAIYSVLLTLGIVTETCDCYGQTLNIASLTPTYTNLSEHSMFSFNVGGLLANFGIYFS